MPVDYDAQAQRVVVSSPVKKIRGKQFPQTAEVVELRGRLSDEEHARVAEMLAARPGITLAVEGRGVENLDFLYRYAGVRRFGFHWLYDLRNWDGLRAITPDLETLDLGFANTARLSLRVIAESPRLRWLRLSRSYKHYEVLARLTRLEHLMLRSAALPDLGWLEMLPALRTLAMTLGRFESPSPSVRAVSLEYLELRDIKSLEDLTPFASIRSLKGLFLQELASVERLPDLAGMTSLEHLKVIDLKRLRSIMGALRAPRLAEFEVYGRNDLQASELVALGDHPAIAYVSAHPSGKHLERRAPSTYLANPAFDVPERSRVSGAHA